MKDIAVIGIAGRFPGAKNLEELYGILAAGQDCVRPLSDERIAATSLPFDKDYIEIAYLEEIDRFDPKYFGISKAEAVKMAPQQRLALEIVHEALDNTGYALGHFYNSRTSLYVGDTHLNYDRHIDGPLDPTEIMGSSNAFLAGRIARAFNLRGAAAMIDTTCSSTLTALHLAVNGLLCGDADHALVVGVNLEEFPIERSSLSFGEEMGANILSPSYRASTFSDRADGTGIGEAAICIVLKPLDAALRDGDFVHAVIKGSAVNQDAALSASLTAPDPEAQSEVIVEAWKKSGIRPEDLGYVEAHGTGTTLGDPIEVDGLKRAFKAFTDREGFCSISSIKTNLGHTDSAAGLAGLAKVILSLQHKVLFPNVHYERPNPLINFERGPVYVQTALAPWEKSGPGPRLAGLSSFGLIGTNCHVVVAEAPVRTEKPPVSADQPFLLAFSAKTPASLRLNVQAFADHFAAHGDLDLEDAAYTLLAGRDHHEKRAAVVVNRANVLPEVTGLLAGAESDVQAARCILVFSGHRTFPAAWISHAVQHVPGFGSQLERIRPQLPAGFQENDRTAAFVFQYCFYQVLHAAGVHFDSLVGDGAGKQVIAVIKGAASVAGALTAIATEPPPAEDLQQRVENLLQRERQAGEPLWMEMGPMGNISAVIAGAHGRLIALQAEEITAWPHFLREIYLSGQNLHWAHLFAATARKVPLPGYQFDRQRCWIRPPSEKPAFTAPIDFFKTRLVAADVPLTAGRPGRKFGVLLSNSGPERARIEAAFPQDELHFPPASGLAGWSSAGDVDAWLVFLFPDDKAVAAWEKPDWQPLLEQWQNWRALAESGRPVHVFAEGALLCSDVPPNTFGAGALALFKGVVTDTGRRDFTFTDLSADDPASWGMLGALLATDADRQVRALRQGRLFYEELAPAEHATRPGGAPVAFPNGAYLVTGGARGIGYEISKSIVAGLEAGALIVVGKTDPAGTERGENLDRLRTLNPRVEVVYFQADMADREAVSAVLNAVKTTYGKLELVVHGAGAGSRGIHFAGEMSASFAPVWAPKIDGTLHLYAALREVEFQKMILFSSLNAVWPQKGSAFYTVANAFVDAFAFRDARIQSVRWPGWSGVGMSADEPAGDWSLTPAEGVAVFHALVASTDKVIMPVKGPLEAFGRNPFFRIAGPETPPPPAAPAPAEATADVQQFVLDLWKKSLQEPDLKTDEDFFEIGGHSLLGTQIVNTLNAAYGIELFFEDLYDYSTVQALAGYVETLRAAASPSTQKEALPTAAPAGRIPLSPAQHGVWVAHQLSGEHGNFNIPGLIELRGELDPETLEAALLAIVYRHETLRSRFEEKDGEVFQSALPPQSVGFRLETEDFSQLAIDDVPAHAQDVSRPFATRTIRLDTELPFRAKLLRYAPDHHVLALALHHIIGDGVSIDIFIGELFENYEEKRRTGQVTPQPLVTTYADYVLEMRAYLASAQFTEDRAWWVRQLQKKVPPLALPYDYERPVLGTKSAGKVEIGFTEAESDLFNAVKNDLKVSGYVLFTALVKLLLFKYHGEGAITIGTPYFGRFKKEYEAPIGLFVNLLVNRDEVRGAMTFTELVQQIRAGYTEAMKHKQFPFEWLARETGVSREINRNPFFDVLVNYWEDRQGLYGASDYQPVHPHLRRRSFGYAEAFVQEDLAFELLGGEKLYASISYDQDLFQPVTVALLKERFLQLLRSLEGGLDRPLTDYDFTLDFEKNGAESTAGAAEEQERF